MHVFIYAEEHQIRNLYFNHQKDILFILAMTRLYLNLISILSNEQ